MSMPRFLFRYTVVTAFWLFFFLGFLPLRASGHPWLAVAGLSLAVLALFAVNRFLARPSLAPPAPAPLFPPKFH